MIKNNFELLKRGTEEIIPEDEFKKKLGYIDAKIQELDAASKNPSVEGGFILVPGSCFPGVEITLYDLSFPVKNLVTGKRFSIRNGLIAVEG